MTAFRSFLFVSWFYLITAPLAVLYAFLLIPPRPVLMAAIRWWVGLVLWGLRVLAGIRVEVRGLEHRPDGAALIAGKHQGMLDTIAPFGFLRDPSLVLKQELLKVPFYGWIARKSQMIPIDREGHSKTLKALVRTARERASEGRQVLIFPEGTRQAPGAPPDYKPGIAALYRDLGLPCVPMATNSGVHWPAHGFRRTPGVVVFELLPPIPPGLKRHDFMRELETRIETASNRLLEEEL